MRRRSHPSVITCRFRCDAMQCDCEAGGLARALHVGLCVPSQSSKQACGSPAPVEWRGFSGLRTDPDATRRGPVPSLPRPEAPEPISICLHRLGCSESTNPIACTDITGPRLVSIAHQRSACSAPPARWRREPARCRVSVVALCTVSWPSIAVEPGVLPATTRPRANFVVIDHAFLLNLLCADSMEELIRTIGKSQESDAHDERVSPARQMAFSKTDGWTGAVEVSDGLCRCC